jgi:ribokinase
MIVAGRIVVVGSLNVDLVVGVDRLPAPGQTVAGRDFAAIPGGKGANQACAAARLGGEVSMIGRVGEDAHGELLRQSLASAGVDVSHVLSDARAATGVALITVERSGQNDIVIVPGANGAFTVEELERGQEQLDSAAVVLLQLEVPLPTVQAAARRARRAGATVILDPAPAAPLPDDLLRDIDYLTPNETELAALVGGARPEGDAEAARQARELIGRGARAVVVKRGERGALLVVAGGETSWPALSVTAVDATAAGDAWNGAFAFALASGSPPAVAGRLATAAAAVSVTRRGAQPSMPTLAEVEALMRERS